MTSPILIPNITKQRQSKFERQNSSDRNFGFMWFQDVLFKRTALMNTWYEFATGSLHPDVGIMWRKGGSYCVLCFTCPLSFHSLVKLHQGQRAEGFILRTVGTSGAHVDAGKSSRHAIHVVPPPDHRLWVSWCSTPFLKQTTEFTLSYVKSKACDQTHVKVTASPLCTWTSCCGMCVIVGSAGRTNIAFEKS